MSRLPQELRGAEVLPPLCPTPNSVPRDLSPSSRHNDPKRTAAGRFAVLNTFVDRAMKGLCKGDIAVWLVLYRDTKNGTATTSQADMARRAGMSVRGVGKALVRLQALGLVRKVHAGGLGRGVNRYVVQAETSPPTTKAS